jgi:hypothetical protein
MIGPNNIRAHNAGLSGLGMQLTSPGSPTSAVPQSSQLSWPGTISFSSRAGGIHNASMRGFAAARVHLTSADEVADYAIAAELVRHRLTATVLPNSAADRFLIYLSFH